MMNYNELAAAYAPNRTINPALFETLLVRPALSENPIVLEVGCGTGNYIGAIARAINCPCHGVDPSAEMLAAASERQPAVTFHPGTAELLPFEANQFDLIYSVDVIHHVSDINAYHREAFRILTPGGQICTATDSPEALRRRRPLSSHFPETVAVEQKRYPAIDTLVASMTEAGFHHIEQQDVEYPYALTDIEPYQQRAFSCLHLINDDAFTDGMSRLEAALRTGPIEALSLYTLVWGRR